MKRILVDENIPTSTVAWMQEVGYDALDFRGSPDEGTADAELWRPAQLENRIVVSTDKGFLSVKNENHSGLLVVRLRRKNRFKIDARNRAILDL